MSAVPVLYGHIYGAPIYEMVAAQCPPELRIDFREQGTDDELLARLPGYEFVIGGGLKRRHFEAAGRLRLLQCLGVGYDGVDIEAARAAGVMVATTPEGTVEGVAEHVVLLILALNKQLLAADRALREGQWLVWQLRPSSFMLAGLTVGLVGLGRIGREVARRLKGFAVELVYHDPVAAPAALEAELGLRRLELDELLGSADIVSVHTPLTPTDAGPDRPARARPDEARGGADQHQPRRGGRPAGPDRGAAGGAAARCRARRVHARAAAGRQSAAGAAAGGADAAHRDRDAPGDGDQGAGAVRQRAARAARRGAAQPGRLSVRDLAVERRRAGPDLAEIVRTLEADIIFGRLKPRERLVEDTLMERLGVTRHLVRQALAELERLGIVVRARNKGCAVRYFPRPRSSTSTSCARCSRRMPPGASRCPRRAR